MKQSRRHSLIEAGISTTVGFGLSLIAQAIFLPLVFDGVHVRLEQNVEFAAIMFLVSLARQYGLRRIFEAMHIRVPLSPALLAIAAERRRQIEQECWTREHDAEHARGELAAAGACYAMMPSRRRVFLVTGGAHVADKVPANWPWGPGWWKPQSDRRDLVRAGALIVAEMDKADDDRKRGAFVA